MKRILILDDMQVRHDAYARMYIGNDFTHVYTADEAIAALQGDRFNAVFLDRDLDDHATMGLTPLEKTGEDVVDYMLTMPVGLRPLVVVHSWNTTAAIRMHDRLRDAGFNVVRQPFRTPGW
jgi:CheY-like chemotaxis protein